jgi:ABC-type multidrug transport system ATPase subunit
MRTLATLQEADSGRAVLGEIDVLRQKDAVRRILGYLPQEFGLYPKVSAESLLSEFAVLKGISNAKERREVVQALLQQTNLYEHRKQALGSFSGGMKQRFGIAQALLGNPRLIIVDEPTAGLDPEERVRFHNLLSAIGQNIIVILSTHIVSDVTDLCQAMAIIHEGRVRVAGNPSALVAQLEGRVWRKSIAHAEVASYRDRFQLISMRLFAGQTLVHLLSPQQPEAGFELAAPDLEDFYFATIKGFIHQAPAGAVN